MKELAPYQLAGATYLMSGKFRLLADDMGLGKTAQVIVASDMVGARKILVICPAVARINWKREFDMWSIMCPDFKICEHLSDKISEQSIVSYEYAAQLTSKINEVEWDLVVVDESQYIKEPETFRTQQIYGKNGIVRHTSRMWCLSGTPAPNHVGELWPLLYTFGATSLSYESFIDKYCDTRPTFYGGQRKNKIVGSKKSTIPQIKEILSKIMLRRLKSEVLKDLPPVIYETLYIEGTPLPDVLIDMGVIAREAALFQSQTSNAQSDDELVAVLEKIGSSVATLRRFLGLQKVIPISEIIISELKAGYYKKIIIFAYHTDVIAKLKAKFHEAGIVTVVLNGKVSTKARQEAIDDFQSKEDCQIFIGQIVAAGVVITLTAAHHVVNLEPSWVPGENKQAIDRANRKGQTMPVHVRTVAIADSLDEKISTVLERKTKQLSQIFDEKSETNQGE